MLGGSSCDEDLGSDTSLFRELVDDCVATAGAGVTVALDAG